MAGNSPFVISHPEFQQFEIQFITQRPADGFLTGEQSRNFFMQSGLPPTILGQIWNLADLTHDGKLDRMEFAIAMKLIRNALANIPPPPSLPEQMKHVQPPPAQPVMRPPAYGMPQMPPPAYLPGSAPAPLLRPTFVIGTKELCDWTIPQSLKLQYAQRFNQLDRNRTDYLTGQQLRGVMSESQLPAEVLAQIWNYADSNKDGYLPIDRFCVAMFLIDKVREGFALPKTLPPELQPHGSRSQTESPVVPQEPGAPPPQKSPAPKTFEDKRLENLSKGEAELERRREVLRKEEEERRRIEVERQERELQLQREREREEMERREAELELQRHRQREIEEQRAAEEARLRAEREEAQRRAQEERVKLLEARHIADVETQLQGEKEKTAQIKQRHNTMSFQLQGLDEKAQQLTSEIGSARDEIMAITTEIEGMRKHRDDKIAEIQRLQTQSQEIAVQTERVSHVNLQLQTESQKSMSRTREIETLRKAIADRRSQIETAETAVAEAKKRYTNQEKLVAEKRPAFEEGQEKLRKLAEVYNGLLAKFVAKQQELHQKMIRKRQEQGLPSEPSQELYEVPPDTNGRIDPPLPFSLSGSFGDSFVPSHPTENNFSQSATTTVQQSSGAVNFVPTTNNMSSGAPHATGKPPVKYRALYEFVARSEDELSLQPGDTILVFEDHVAEPGWLAGQIREKVGWFPASFAEPTGAKKPAAAKQSSLTTSPSAEPLESIKEEPAEKELAGGIANVVLKSSTSSNSLQKERVSNGHVQTPVDVQPMTPLPIYDAPPGNEVPISTPAVAAAVESKEGDGSTVVVAVGTAAFAWKARHDNELSFARGDRIEVLEQKEMRWRGRIGGQSNGASGWFPKSYVKLSDDGGAPSSTTTDPPVNSTAKESGDWYIAVFPFDAAEPTDLTLKVGDRIWVPEETRKGEWWSGTVDSRTGIFPSNYAQKAEEALKHSSTSGSLTAAQSPLESPRPTKTAESGVANSRRISAASTGGEWFVALYQFDAVEPTDLSLKVGDRIWVTEKKGDWWNGTVDSRSGIFPANYVEKAADLTENSTSEFLRPTSAANHEQKIETASPALQENPKLQKQIQELIETELRFADDLLMVRNVFMKPLIRVIGTEGIERIFLNWDSLIKISKRIHTDLLKRPPGQVFCRRIDLLDGFVQFCEHQQGAITYLNELERSDPKFRKVYVQCVQSPQARNMSLGYFLLLPMSRITRYPLVFESMIKLTAKEDPRYEALTDAHQLLKSLCSRVNQAITELENKNILCWSQQNIRCDGLSRALEFPSETHEIGPREYLHSGVLYKMKSNKLLVAFLYNDLLLLTTPNEPIDSPDSFKVTKELHLRLTMYKQPLMLESLEVVNTTTGSASPAHEDTSFTLKSPFGPIQMRAPSRNAKSFWVNQLQKAIDQYDVAVQLRKAEDQPKSPTHSETPEIGRLLVEVLSITPPLSSTISNLRLKLRLEPTDEPAHETRVTVRDGQSIYTTQFPLRSFDQTFSLGFYVPMEFRPDVLLGRTRESVKTLVHIRGSHPGPIIRLLKLTDGEVANVANSDVNVKFFVHQT